MKKANGKNIIKRIFSIFFGLIITFFLLIIIEEYLFHNYYNNIQPMEILLICIMYFSGILFLVLWNINKSKLIYLLFIAPVVCIGFGIGLREYRNYIYSIPRVYEGLNLYFYEPFNKDRNRLARIDEISNYKLTNNLPILDGATAFYPIYAAFVQEVYPENEYRHWRSPVFCRRTANAYINLLEGNVDIIFCLEPSEAQLQLFIDNNKNLKFVPIGREAFVFFVNINNPVSNLNAEDIQGIYSGKITNWRQLGGRNNRILAYQRPKNSGSQTILEKIMNNTPIINPLLEDIMEDMEKIINQVAVYRNFNNAIGYSFLMYTTEMVGNDQIKILSINNIYPSTETIQDNSYPFIVNIYAIYNNTEEKNENIEPFLEWILSEQGQELVSKTGYVPIRNK